jgi:hypothetical protein
MSFKQRMQGAVMARRQGKPKQQSNGSKARQPPTGAGDAWEPPAEDDIGF